MKKNACHRQAFFLSRKRNGNLHVNVTAGKYNLIMNLILNVKAKEETGNVNEASDSAYGKPRRREFPDYHTPPGKS